MVEGTFNAKGMALNLHANKYSGWRPGTRKGAALGVETHIPEGVIPRRGSDSSAYRSPTSWTILPFTKVSTERIFLMPSSGTVK